MTASVGSDERAEFVRSSRENRALHRDSHRGVVVAVAPVGLRDGGVQNGHGRTTSYRMSELTALLEALERHGGMRRVVSERWSVPATAR